MPPTKPAGKIGYITVTNLNWPNNICEQNKDAAAEPTLLQKQKKNILNLFLHNRDSVIIEQLLYSNLLPVEKPEQQLRKYVN